MRFAHYVLKNEFLKRQKKNGRYSLRSYARDLGLNPGTVSAILNGQRTLPAKKVESVARKLLLSPNETSQLLKSLKIAPNFEQIQIKDDEYQFQILSEWEHYAVLCLLETVRAKSDPQWIAERLNISIGRAELVIERLLLAGLVGRAGKKLELRPLELTTTEDIKSRALQKAHREELSIAEKALDAVAVEMRDFSSITIAGDPSRINKAKQAIRRFRKELEAILEDGPKTEVFQICIQMFPLTETKSKKNGAESGDLS